MSYSHAPSTTFLLTVIGHYPPPGSICHIPTFTPVSPPLMLLNSSSCLSSGTSVTSIITPVVSTGGHSLGTGGHILCTTPTAHKPFLIKAGLPPIPNMLVQHIQAGSFVGMTELAIDHLGGPLQEDGEQS